MKFKQIKISTPLQISTQLTRKKEYNSSDEEDPPLQQVQLDYNIMISLLYQYRPYRYINYSYHYLSLCIVFQTTPPSTGVSVPPDDTDRVSGKSINTYTVTCVCVLLE